MPQKWPLQASRTAIPRFPHFSRVKMRARGESWISRRENSPARLVSSKLAPRRSFLAFLTLYKYFFNLDKVIFKLFLFFYFLGGRVGPPPEVGKIGLPRSNRPPDPPTVPKRDQKMAKNWPFGRFLANKLMPVGDSRLVCIFCMFTYKICMARSALADWATQNATHFV